MDEFIGFLGSALIFSLIFVLAAGAMSFVVLLADRLYKERSKQTPHF